MLVPNATSRSVYLPRLPAGEAWFPFFFNITATTPTIAGGGAAQGAAGHAGTGMEGGQRVTVPAPLGSFPLFERREREHNKLQE